MTAFFFDVLQALISATIVGFVFSPIVDVLGMAEDARYYAYGQCGPHGNPLEWVPDRACPWLQHYSRMDPVCFSIFGTYPLGRPTYT